MVKDEDLPQIAGFLASALFKKFGNPCQNLRTTGRNSTFSRPQAVFYIRIDPSIRGWESYKGRVNEVDIVQYEIKNLTINISPFEVQGIHAVPISREQKKLGVTELKP